MKNRFLGVGESGYHPLRKIKVCLNGLKFALSDFSVAYKVALSAVVVVASIWLRHWIDLVVVLVVTGQVLTAEMFNTAIEAVCDYLETGHDQRIGIIKDVAAASAGVSIFVWAAVIGYEYYELWPWFPKPGK
jgi:diacylglycerol kinase